MSDVVIKARGIGKEYRLGSAAAGYRTLRESLMGAFRRRTPVEAEQLWALRDVDFDVRCGEVVGVIGRNGAGKSTLLKILSRVTTPTTGTIELVGRIGSLLEVGTGFHPELSGRENIFMNGALLGMSRRDILAKFDDIVAFAEVERFIDTPVKRYSSGMYTRLAFAVAAHLEPDILIIDEVLAVGDVMFQKKCLGKMGEIAGRGRTVLFVSHNMPVVNSLCSTGILLAGGQVLVRGSVQDVVSQYLAVGAETANERKFDPRDAELSLVRATVTQDGTDAAFVTTLPVQVTMDVQVRDMDPELLICGFALRDSHDNPVLTSYSVDGEQHSRMKRFDGSYRFTCTIPANLLNDGAYDLVFDVGLANRRRVTTDDEHRLRFRMNNVNGIGSRFGTGWRKGSVLTLLDWSHEATA